jgi:hypothetical protein
MKLTQQKEIATILRDDGNSEDPRFAAREHVSSGIVVLSSTCKVLYVNKAAQDFLVRLNRNENGHSTHGAFPGSVDNLLDEMLKLLPTAVGNRGWRQLEARPLLAASDESVLVQAFGIPDRLDLQRSRIVLTIQETSHPVCS